MAELTLVSTRQHSLKPLVEAALANELRLLEAGIRRTEHRLHELEARYQLSTEEFVRRFEDDEFGETLEFAEWIRISAAGTAARKGGDVTGDRVCELRIASLPPPRLT
jgi:hypothetical protein